MPDRTKSKRAAALGLYGMERLGLIDHLAQNRMSIPFAKAAQGRSLERTMDLAITAGGTIFAPLFIALSEMPATSQ